MKAILNARLIVPDSKGDFQVLEHMAVVYDETIADILSMEEFRAIAGVDEVFDAAGTYGAPGFINIHIHGCMGKDTMDADDEVLPAMSRCQAETGVTAFLPTTMTYDFPKIYRSLEQIKAGMQQSDGAAVLGCHMEGPFISEAHKGAQAAIHIMKADWTKIAPYQDVVRIITLAPEELEGDYSFVEQCQAAGIIVSIGHSSADYETAMEAVTKHGVKHITHLFNAMTGMHHRKPGVVGAALDTDANCELIVDNVHVHPAVQRLVYHAKQGRHIILITDSMRACGLGDGESELGGQKVWVKGTLATLEDGTIAGSVLRMNRGIQIFRENTGAPLAKVVEMVTRTPAEELGIYGRQGSIERGKQADFAIFDDAMQIAATIVKGKRVYEDRQV